MLNDYHINYILYSHRMRYIIILCYMRMRVQNYIIVRTRTPVETFRPEHYDFLFFCWCCCCCCWSSCPYIFLYLFVFPFVSGNLFDVWRQKSDDLKSKTNRLQVSQDTILHHIILLWWFLHINIIMSSITTVLCLSSDFVLLLFFLYMITSVDSFANTSRSYGGWIRP